MIEAELMAAVWDSGGGIRRCSMSLAGDVVGTLVV